MSTQVLQHLVVVFNLKYSHIQLGDIVVFARNFTKRLFVAFVAFSLLLLTGVSSATAQTSTETTKDDEVIDCSQAAQTRRYNSGGGVVTCILRAACRYYCYYQRTRSCFPPDTQIQMADGNTKRIDEINSGDLVWNPALNKAVKVGKMISGPESDPLYEIGYGTTKVRVTKTHPMVVQNPELNKVIHPASLSSSDSQGSLPNARVKKANQLTVNDSILGADGEFHKVTVVRQLPVDPDQQVFNFELESTSGKLANHMIVADGIVTGDVSVQAELNGYKLPWETK